VDGCWAPDMLCGTAHCSCPDTELKKAAPLALFRSPFQGDTERESIRLHSAIRCPAFQNLCSVTGAVSEPCAKLCDSNSIAPAFHSQATVHLDSTLTARSHVCRVHANTIAPAPTTRCLACWPACNPSAPVTSAVARHGGRMCKGRRAGEGPHRTLGANNPRAIKTVHPPTGITLRIQAQSGGWLGFDDHWLWFCGSHSSCCGAEFYSIRTRAADAPVVHQSDPPHACMRQGRRAVRGHASVDAQLRPGCFGRCCSPGLWCLFKGPGSFFPIFMSELAESCQELMPRYAKLRRQSS